MLISIFFVCYNQLFLQSLLAGDDICNEACYHCYICANIYSVDVVPSAKVAEDENQCSNKNKS